MEAGPRGSRQCRVGGTRLLTMPSVSRTTTLVCHHTSSLESCGCQASLSVMLGSVGRFLWSFVYPISGTSHRYFSLQTMHTF